MTQLPPLLQPPAQHLRAGSPRSPSPCSPAASARHPPSLSLSLGATPPLCTWPAGLAADSRVRQPAASTAASSASGASSPADKPPLLARIELQLQHELRLHGVEERRADARRYQAFREALLRLAASFHTYQPLLTAIGNEFELYVDHLKARLDELAPVQVRACLMALLLPLFSQ